MKRIILIGFCMAVAGCDAVMGCDYYSQSADLSAEMMERNLPISVTQRLTALHTRATAHEMRGEHEQACTKLEEAFELIQRY
ncbi:MAG: hypothetical protein COB66_05205 [Coxiella sp. (in: Bacteria)]|nr:MAG: hypothetical protein COB66_05205 [Coxiella sp. (in: g-proteobacteria)]